ncbi:MAG: SUMF1/EgtB/PvdO family nonheme iron enzyme [Bacteroidia bacterium]
MLKHLENMILKTGFTFFFFIAILPVFANNLSVTNISFTSVDTVNNNVKVKFNISWNNSWRLNTPPLNRDASWVFVKYRTCVAGSGVGNWQHATLSTTSSHHINPTGSSIDPSGDGKGAFIYRSAVGSGTFSLTDVMLQWNYGTDGLNDNFEVELRVFAVEMVHINEEPFYLGSGGTESGAFYKYPSTANPYLVSSEGQIHVATVNNSLYYLGSSSNGDQNGPIPAAFPKGYNDFYIMKYEMSHKQWVDFLNTITSAQALLLSNVAFVGNYGLNISGSWPNFSTTVPDRPINYLYNVSVLAYLDWAALRPMTELEFEKACRGPITPVPNEYPWGQITIHSTNYSLTSSGSNSESVSIGANKGNAYFSSVIANTANRPIRCGAFANDTTTREEAGSTYYGVMEMAGNLFEYVVSAGNPTGRAFLGTHGNGAISPDGYANITDWPGYNSSVLLNSGNVGFGVRGSSFGFSVTNLKTSDRTFGQYIISSQDLSLGCRGVRTAP